MKTATINSNTAPESRALEAGDHTVRIGTYQASIDMETGEPTAAVEEIVLERYNRGNDAHGACQTGKERNRF
ncbi:MAG: hypothetical protein R3C09_21670 [Pirellulaceae bacterium]